MINPLVSFPADGPTGTPKVGTLVTWVDYAGRKVGGRLTDWRNGYAWLTVAGLNVQHPYQVGMPITVDQSQVVDWD